MSSSSSSSSSSTSRYVDLCKEIDGCLYQQIQLDTLVCRPQYKLLATKLVKDVDWKWVPEAHKTILSTYQLFILCKIVAEDFTADSVTHRLQLSPTPAIDSLWHEHILRVGKYVEMHRVLGLGEKVLDHTPESSTDSDADKEVRVQAMKEYIAFLCPSLTAATVSLISASTNKRQRTSDAVDSRPASLAAAIPDETVTFVLSDQAGEKMHFKVKKDTKLQKVFDAYAVRLGVSSCSLTFRFVGERISGDVSPRMLEMEDDDMVEVIMIQTGC